MHADSDGLSNVSRLFEQWAHAGSCRDSGSGDWNGLIVAPQRAANWKPADTV